MTGTMTGLAVEQWAAYRDAYMFIGAELLTPMNRSGELRGLDPLFWEAAPVPENAGGRKGLGRLQKYALAASASASAQDGAHDPQVPGMLQTSVEFTRLFIGPPKPAAEPWETMNDPENERHIGYGRATVEMKELIAAEGLALSNENHQYEDHMGIELIYLAVLCEKAAGEQDPAAEDSYIRRSARFISRHPRRWIEHLRAAVDQCSPDGYYSALLEYAQGVLDDQAAALESALA